MDFFLLIFVMLLIMFIFIYNFILIERRKFRYYQLKERKEAITNIVSFAERSYFIPKKADFPGKSFPNYMLFWSEHMPNVDTTNWALDITESLKDLFNVTGYVSDYINNNRDKIFKFVLDHFDEKYGGFKQNIHSWPSIYATNHAISLIKKLIPEVNIFDPLGIEKSKEILGKNRVKQLIKFVYKCQSSTKYGIGFAETWYDNTPNIVSTDAAMLLLWNFEDLPDNLEKIIEFLKKSFKEYHLDNKYIYGALYHPYDVNPPCSSCTRFVLKSLTGIQAIKEGSTIREMFESEKFISFLEEQDIKLQNLKGIIELIKSCKAEDNSFSAYPFNKKTDAYHTYCVSSLLSYIIKVTSLDIDKEEILDINKLMKYIKECKADNGGYDISNNRNKFSSLFGTRAVIEILSKLKGIFEDKFYIEPSEKGLMINGLEKFLRLCLDEERCGFYAFPLIAT